MAARTPTWIKNVAISVLGAAGIVAALVRYADPKKVMLSQLTVPHGPLGHLAARLMPMAHKVFYAPAADRLDLRPDDELLEVACGSGVFLEAHAGHVRRVAGLDLSDIQVDLARRRMGDRLRAGTAEIVQGDAVELPWEDDTFTAVACMGSMEYFPDPGAALREMCRVLQPGGRMVLSYGFDESDEDTRKATAALGLPCPTEEEARKLVEEAGFALVAVSYLEGDYPIRYLEGMKPE